MSLADYKITEEQIANKRISTLSIRATDPIESGGSGISGTGFKSRIDALALFIIEKVNAVIDILTAQGVDTLAADLQAAIDRIAANEGDITVINDAIIAINAALDALEGRISTNESNISGLQATIASLVSDVETAIENAEKATTEANNAADTVNGLIDTVNADIQTNAALRDELADYQNSLKEIRVVDDIVARDAIENLYEGLRVHCIDATADVTVESGWAEYLCKSDGEGGFEWTKTSEKDSIDVIQSASNVSYSNQSSELTATNVQGAIDELKSEIDSIDVVLDAENVDYDNTLSGLTSENTQDAIDELNTKVDENNAFLWQQLCDNPKYHRIPYNATEGDIISLPLENGNMSFDVYYGSIANKRSYTSGGTKEDFISNVTGYIDIIIVADSSFNMPGVAIKNASNASLFVGKPRYSNLKTAIPATAFYNTNIVDFDIPNSITSIGNWAFRDTLLKQIFIPDSVVSLGTSCFTLCTSLTKVRLPSYLTAIPDSCFEHCFELYDIVIPKNVTSIGSGAFASNGNYKNISFGGRKSISMGTGAFNGVSAILNFYEWNPTKANDIITSFKNRGGRVIFSNNLEPAAKAASPTEDNIATLTADGDPKDSGKAFSATAVAGTVPVYGTDGVLKVADGSASGDAVNKGQLDRYSPLGVTNTGYTTLRVAASSSFVLPLATLGSATAYFIDWGDGTKEFFNDTGGNKAHSYSIAKIYTIEINNNIPLNFGSDSSAAQRVIEIPLIYSNLLGDNALKGCSNMRNIRSYSGGVIGASALENCYSIRKIELSEYLTGIKANAFKNCIELFHIHYYGNATWQTSDSGADYYIGADAFRGVTAMVTQKGGNFSTIAVSRGLTLLTPATS
jgi:hypothetical protein